MNRQQLHERLAAIEHQRWADWQKWVHDSGTRNPDGTITLPANCVARWDQQIATPYGALSEADKDKDRLEVGRYWPLIETELAEVEQLRGGPKAANRPYGTRCAQSYSPNGEPPFFCCRRDVGHQGPHLAPEGLAWGP